MHFTPKAIFFVSFAFDSFFRGLLVLSFSHLSFRVSLFRYSSMDKGLRPVTSSLSLYYHPHCFCFLLLSAWLLSSFFLRLVLLRFFAVWQMLSLLSFSFLWSSYFLFPLSEKFDDCLSSRWMIVVASSWFPAPLWQYLLTWCMYKTANMPLHILLLTSTISVANQWQVPYVLNKFRITI